MFLSNVPKEIRSTEMAEIPSEPGAEQATKQGVGRGKSCSILSREEGRAGGGSVLAPPQIPPGWALFFQCWFILVLVGCGKSRGSPVARDGEAQPPSQIVHGVF